MTRCTTCKSIGGSWGPAGFRDGAGAWVVLIANGERLCGACNQERTRLRGGPSLRSLHRDASLTVEDERR